MDDITVVPVYRVVNTLRSEIADNMAAIAQNILSNNFDEAEQLLIETRRMVLTLQTLMEA